MKESEDKQISKIKWIGVFYAWLQTFLLLCRNTIVKKLKLDAGDVLLLTGGHQVFFALLIALIKGVPLWIWEVDKDRNIKNIRLLLGTFAICSGVMVVSELVAVSYIPLGDAMTIILSSVIPTMVFSSIFLKERLRLYKILCAVIVTCGIILVARPPFLFKHVKGATSIKDDHFNSTRRNESSEMDSSKSQYYYFGFCMAIICMISMGIVRVTLRSLMLNSTTCYFELYWLYKGLGSFVIALILPLIGGNQQILQSSTVLIQIKYGLWEWISLYVATFMTILNDYFMFKALSKISSMVFGFVRTSDIIIAYLMQIAFFDTELSITCIIGSCCVLIACIGILFEETFTDLLHPSVKYIF